MHARHLCLATILSAAALAPLPATAAQRTFVASFGNDANPCSISSPCRGIARALTQTDANGEVIVLDSAGYGAFTINQSVSVIAPPGVYAGISVFSGIGINTSGAQMRVTLRGLTIHGQGGAVGVRIAGPSGTRFTMEDCTVKGLSDTGVFIVGLAEATLTNVQIQDNSIGILARDGARVSVSRSVISGHEAGMQVRAESAGSPTTGVITDSVLSHNRQGVTGSSTIAAARVRVVAVRNQVINGEIGIAGLGLLCADATCVQMVATGNVVDGMTESGILAFPGSTVVASGNTVSNSAVGLDDPATGILISMQDNVSELNTGNTFGTITPGTLR